ncbi:type IV pili methyl-accepting chemotaxis transducer N-terminal domain-containing protein, partial [Escherichia coli]|nr:type IV pili methyl-accepting chemotaxis transducer N-terminal domain-containing protein [Escherichia coli]
SATVLARDVRALARGDDGLEVQPAAAAVQPAIEPLLPLVDRAEKNAATVLAQQQILTQVGQALRTINRQSSDLLEIAETIASL